ncbi:MAG: hypothetical protein ACRD1E_13645, partial [Terriglobales bacterium]
MPAEEPFQWTFRTALAEQTGVFLQLVAELAPDFDAQLCVAQRALGVVVRAQFRTRAEAEDEEAEERGRA